MVEIVKYPRTYHIEGSRFQPGDEDLDSVPFSAICDRPTIIEEKVDGANCAISFAPDGQMMLQSRGHFLTGGPREKHFNLFKQWAYRSFG
jgi:RNA ligase